MVDITNNIALLRLFQLVSPALPVGAYAYSQGLECAVDQKWINDEEETRLWLTGLLKSNLAYLDVPVLKRLYEAWEENDLEELVYWNRFLYVSRESHELQKEDQHLGAALMRLLTQLGVEDRCRELSPTCYATAFTLAATTWSVPKRDALTGYVWSWLENQVAAAIKLVPLGQTAGQRILSEVLGEVPDAIDVGLSLSDEQIGFIAPSLAMASAAHEAQYSRLFQS